MCPGVKVGQTTLIRGNGPLKVGEGPVRTGVTVWFPHERVYDEYIPFGFHILNGNGEVTGLTQAANLGDPGRPLCAPTNTSSVGMVYGRDAVAVSVKRAPVDAGGRRNWDAFLNDVEGRHVHAGT